MCWEKLREILGSDYPGLALRPMQRLGLLTEILPEFGLIDSLVVRDFYHRYTVDEHTLRTIEHVQALAGPRDERGAHFIQLWKTVDRRDLLILALLLHDVGKGMPVENHVTGSLAALDSGQAFKAFARGKGRNSVAHRTSSGDVRHGAAPRHFRSRHGRRIRRVRH